MFCIKTHNYILLGLFASVCVGCSTYTPMRWNHTALSGADSDRQFLIDDGQCVAKSTAAVDVPQMPVRQGSTNISIQQQGSSTQIQDPDVFESYQDGVAQGSNQRRVDDARNAQHRVYAGCMAERGWSQVPAQP